MSSNPPGGGGPPPASGSGAGPPAPGGLTLPPSMQHPRGRAFPGPHLHPVPPHFGRHHPPSGHMAAPSPQLPAIVKLPPPQGAAPPGAFLPPVPGGAPVPLVSLPAGQSGIELPAPGVGPAIELPPPGIGPGPRPVTPGISLPVVAGFDSTGAGSAAAPSQGPPVTGPLPPPGMPGIHPGGLQLPGRPGAWTLPPAPADPGPPPNYGPSHGPSMVDYGPRPGAAMATPGSHEPPSSGVTFVGSSASASAAAAAAVPASAPAPGTSAAIPQIAVGPPQLAAHLVAREGGLSSADALASGGMAASSGSLAAGPGAAGRHLFQQFAPDTGPSDASMSTTRGLRLVTELETQLHSGVIAVQTTALSRLPGLLATFPLAEVVNTAVLRLVDFFCGTRSVALRHACLGAVRTMAATGLLGLILNIEEVVTSLTHETAFGMDPAARALTIRMVSEMASVLADRVEIHNVLRETLSSSSESSTTCDFRVFQATISAADRVAALSPVFASSILEKIVTLLQDLRHPASIRVSLICLLKHMWPSEADTDQAVHLCFAAMRASRFSSAQDVSLPLIEACIGTLLSLVLRLPARRPALFQVLTAWAQTLLLGRRQADKAHPAEDLLAVPLSTVDLRQEGPAILLGHVLSAIRSLVSQGQELPVDVCQHMLATLMQRGPVSVCAPICQVLIAAIDTDQDRHLEAVFGEPELLAAVVGLACFDDRHVPAMRLLVVAIFRRYHLPGDAASLATLDSLADKLLASLRAHMSPADEGREAVADLMIASETVDALELLGRAEPRAVLGALVDGTSLIVIHLTVASVLFDRLEDNTTSRAKMAILLQLQHCLAACLGSVETLPLDLAPANPTLGPSTMALDLMDRLLEFSLAQPVPAGGLSALSGASRCIELLATLVLVLGRFPGLYGPAEEARLLAVAGRLSSGDTALASGLAMGTEAEEASAPGGGSTRVVSPQVVFQAPGLAFLLCTVERIAGFCLRTGRAAPLALRFLAALPTIDFSHGLLHRGPASSSDMDSRRPAGLTGSHIQTAAPSEVQQLSRRLLVLLAGIAATALRALADEDAGLANVPFGLVLRAHDDALVLARTLQRFDQLGGRAASLEEDFSPSIRSHYRFLCNFLLLQSRTFACLRQLQQLASLADSVDVDRLHAVQAEQLAAHLALLSEGHLKLIRLHFDLDSFTQAELHRRSILLHILSKAIRSRDPDSLCLRSALGLLGQPLSQAPPPMEEPDATMSDASNADGDFDFAFGSDATGGLDGLLSLAGCGGSPSMEDAPAPRVPMQHVAAFARALLLHSPLGLPAYVLQLLSSELSGGLSGRAGDSTQCLLRVLPTCHATAPASPASPDAGTMAPMEIHMPEDSQLVLNVAIQVTPPSRRDSATLERILCRHLALDAGAQGAGREGPRLGIDSFESWSGASSSAALGTLVSDVGASPGRGLPVAGSAAGPPVAALVWCVPLSGDLAATDGRDLGDPHFRAPGPGGPGPADIDLVDLFSASGRMARVVPLAGSSAHATDSRPLDLATSDELPPVAGVSSGSAARPVLSLAGGQPSSPASQTALRGTRFAQASFTFARGDLFVGGADALPPVESADLPLLLDPAAQSRRRARHEPSPASASSPATVVSLFDPGRRRRLLVSALLVDPAGRTWFSGSYQLVDIVSHN
ncbi:hypothetical protein H696_02601 [Fonticula alba]|uniref:Integrator complex subunit 7 N-terminal domain-containing protein n=1 Tax=Fonticula alba TaxID=691883 RepID=A0A058Z825_FONAL|nr:hypothetical protein H696_02601 [Fonticula alba]KCV70271.1 hypothetical protein H696_02601 [Fonticula alba]|eukprot:XP_009494787.1 hypothetical protein H696_02601 [Fonticula alba]